MAQSSVRLGACVQLREVACTVSMSQGCLALQLSFSLAVAVGLGGEVAEGEVLALVLAEVESTLFESAQSPW